MFQPVRDLLSDLIAQVVGVLASPDHVAGNLLKLRLELGRVAAELDYAFILWHGAYPFLKVTPDAPRRVRIVPFLRAT